MAQTTWILVANSSKAKLYANIGPKKGMQLLREFDHPESRMRNQDLVTDKQGQNEIVGKGHGQGQYQPEVEPKQNEARIFARSLARELGQGRATNQFARIILVAPPAFLGLLNNAMDDQTSQLVSDRFEKDYTKATDKELAGHLESCIYL